MGTVTNTTPAILPELEAAAAQIISAPLNDFLTSIQADESDLNIAAQAVKLQGAFVGAIPALKAVGVKDTAAYLQAKLNGFVSSVTVPKA